MRKPKVFLFDEPLSNLDAKLRVQMRAEISRLHQQLGATMLYVTHDQVEAMTMGTRITLMKDGDIHQIDKFRSRSIASRRTVSWRSSSEVPAMNIFDGSLQTPDSEGAVFETGAFSVQLGSHSRPSDDLPQNIAIGIRPENLAFRGRRRSPRGSWMSTVELVEPLGSEIYLHGRVGDRRMVARIGPNHPVEVGDQIRLAMDLRPHSFFRRRVRRRHSSPIEGDVVCGDCGRPDVDASLWPFFA